MAQLSDWSDSQLDADRLVCSFLDADMYGRDLALLLPRGRGLPHGDWLNSSCLNFGLRLLEARVSAAAAAAATASGMPGKAVVDPVYLIDPSVMSFLRFQCDDEDLDEYRVNVSLCERELLLCPINDTSAGLDARSTGSHWSLLAYWRTAGTFHHFDSAGGLNDGAARATAQVLLRALVGGGAPATPVVEVFSSSSSSSVMPRQSNGVDCGVYALCAAEHHVDALLLLCRRARATAAAAKAHQGWNDQDHGGSSNQTRLTAEMVAGARAEYLESLHTGALVKALSPAVVAAKRADLHAQAIALGRGQIQLPRTASG